MGRSSCIGRRVGTVTRDVSFRATVVASAFLGLGALPTDVTEFRTVVTLGALWAVAGHVVRIATSEASFLVATAAEAATEAAAMESTGVGAGTVGAIASNVA